MAERRFNNWDRVAQSINPAAKRVIKKTAVDGMANVKARIVSNNQVDTGFMLSSVYFVTSDQSAYRGGDKALPQVAMPGNELEAWVAVAAKYAIIQEDGSIYQPGRPFFRPGMERTRQGFHAAMILIKQAMERAAQQ